MSEVAAHLDWVAEHSYRPRPMNGTGERRQ